MGLFNRGIGTHPRRRYVRCRARIRSGPWPIEVPPIPKAGPLAQPKSPHEVGLASLTSRDYEEAGRMELARQRAVALKQRPQRDTNRALGPQPPRLKPPSP